MLHPTRESIVEAIRWTGPLSAPDRLRTIDDPELHLACHVRAPIGEALLFATDAQPAGDRIEMLYCLAPR
jgi:hypothetical protein